MKCLGTLAAVLREQGLSEAVYASYDADKYMNAGDFSLYIDLTENGVEHRDHVMAIVKRYLGLLRDKGVNEKYFKEIRQSLRNSFRFKEKANDYEYAMQIAANLQYVPTEYVLSSDFTYQRFDAAAIEDVLAQLRLTNARIFYIDKQQPVNTKMKNFVGQYSVSEINDEQFNKWQELASEYTLHLPRANNFMPVDFAIVPAKFTVSPKALVKQLGYKLYLGHSKLFAEPKGLFFVELNTGFAKQSPRNHVLSNILGRVLEQQSTELQSEAYIAGMGLKVSINNGVSLTLSGFTQRQGELLQNILDNISSLNITQADLENYIADFKSDIESAKSQILLDQLFPKYRKVLNLDNYNDSDLLDQVQGISVNELLAFKDGLLKKANLSVFAYGNYQQEEAIFMANKVLEALPKERDFSDFYLSAELNPQAGQGYDWREDVNMTDVAFVDTYLAPFDIHQFAALQILEQFIQPALFQQIRTEEQLAYALGFFSQKINEQILFGYYIQSPVAGVATAYQRIAQFRAGFIEQLHQMSEQEFVTVKNSVLRKLLEPAKHLHAEVAYLLDDWRLNNVTFDSKDRLVSALNNVKRDDVLGFYKKMQSENAFGRVMIQLRGANFREQPFISIDNAIPVGDVELLHHQQPHSGMHSH
ncbi:insulinase family protein [Paraglaciecola aquimarina]|uniref:Protease 3 n=1 Tax=Paraglaciecola aquimarina TaxID=1235557 RepID=A0ABU3T1Q8_9ALTE|nr:insulinase family protein [Paraglaciecola aquimarina]MDU0356162.1 insulinase family protein [Paraglaciecola aquimarina]